MVLVDAFRTVVSFVSTSLSIGETPKIGSNDKVHATFLGCKQHLPGWLDKEPSLEGKQLILDHLCNKHEHRLGWPPSVQLNP